MALTNRETVRDGLTALLAALAGDGNPVQTVTGHGLSTLDEVSHIVVLSSGSTRAPGTHSANWSIVYLTVQVWVLYSDQGDWGRDDAEDKLDEIEKEIADLLETNRYYSGYWDTIEYDGRSRVSEVTTVTGLPYLVETIPLRAELLSG